MLKKYVIAALLLLLFLQHESQMMLRKRAEEENQVSDQLALRESDCVASQAELTLRPTNKLLSRTMNSELAFSGFVFLQPVPFDCSQRTSSPGGCFFVTRSDRVC